MSLLDGSLRVATADMLLNNTVIMGATFVALRSPFEKQRSI